MISIVVWKWEKVGYRSTFGPETVNVMASMVRRHYGKARLICVTNDRDGLDPGIEVVADREDFANLGSPHGPRGPSCYRRLRLFAPDAGATFGERIVSLDLDCVLTGDVRPLWDRAEAFVGLRDPIYATQMNGSMFLLRAGSRPKVWTDFDPVTSPRRALGAGFKGSDQGWISYCLRGEATWSRADGVYSYRIDHLERGLPDDARVTVWHGNIKPWESESAWVTEHYR